MVKLAKVGLYGNKDRALQRQLAYEHIAHTFKTAYVWKYLGSRANTNPSIDDIQNVTFMEVPDRAYAAQPIEINIDYDRFPERTTDLSQFGIIDPSSDKNTFRVHLNSFAQDQLGRYLINGDVLEIPFLEQDGKKSYWHVDDVDRKQEFEKFYIVIDAKPLESSRRTEEIPDKNDTENVMNNVEDQLEQEFDDTVSQDGLNTDDVEVTDPNDNPDDYDSRDDNQGSILDDPNRTF